jgi:hypothetical protein
MHIRLSVLIALCSFFLTLTHAFAQDSTPPTAGLFFDGFSRVNQAWLPASGSWSISNGTYGNATAGSSNISVVTVYEGVGHPSLPTEFVGGDYSVSARMRNQGTNDTHLVGLVYGYQDPQNYFEVVISALGTVTMRTVMNGIAVDEGPSAHLNLPRNTWFSVAVRMNEGVATVTIDGLGVSSASQPEFNVGRAGLVTHGTLGRFDNVGVSTPFGDQGFTELFDGAPSVAFSPQSGQWVVTNGTYRNNAVQATSVTLAPIDTGIHNENGDTSEFTFRARMLNPYANAGNLIGIVFHYESSTRYAEVVFSPTGVAKVNRIINGVASTVATASYGGSRNVAFDVTLEQIVGSTSVLVNGQRIFTNVGASPSPSPHGGVGLITHWAPGRFDNVQFDHGRFNGCSQTFSDSSALFIESGAWNTNGATLNSTAVGQSDVVAFFGECRGNDVGEDAGTNFVYGARLLNEYGASGNLVGLLYNYGRRLDPVGDYYEVVFSSTGGMQVNKFIQGVRTTVATATHSIPRNTWFNVQVVREGLLTGIQINGDTVIRNLLQPELRGGAVGVITHWAKGRFDNVSMTDRPTRLPSEL